LLLDKEADWSARSQIAHELEGFVDEPFWQTDELITALTDVATDPSEVAGSVQEEAAIALFCAWDARGQHDRRVIDRLVPEARPGMLLNLEHGRPEWLDGDDRAALAEKHRRAALAEKRRRELTASSRTAWLRELRDRNRVALSLSIEDAQQRAVALLRAGGPERAMLLESLVWILRGPHEAELRDAVIALLADPDEDFDVLWHAADVVTWWFSPLDRAVFEALPSFSRYLLIEGKTGGEDDPFTDADRDAVRDEPRRYAARLPPPKAMEALVERARTRAEIEEARQKLVALLRDRSGGADDYRSARLWAAWHVRRALAGRSAARWLDGELLSALAEVATDEEDPDPRVQEEAVLALLVVWLVRGEADRGTLDRLVPHLRRLVLEQIDHRRPDWLTDHDRAELAQLRDASRNAE
jgi:hypothetical protein